MGDLNLRQIEVFRATMKFGTVTAAAAALASSQPTITRELRRLEDTVGFSLFERRRQRLHPTARALKLYHEVQASFIGLDRINVCVDGLRGSYDEILYIATLPAFAQNLLPEALQRLMTRHPHVSVRIDTSDPRDQSPISGFNFDIGLIEGSYGSESADVLTVGSFDQVCVIPAGHALAEKKVLVPEDFHDVDFISLGDNDPFRMQIDRMFDEAGVTRKMSISTQSANAVCEMVACGLGVAIINPLTALSYRDKPIVLRRLSRSIRFLVSALRPANRPVVNSGESLVQYLTAVCGERARLLESILEK
ncbi:MAG: LysR family transcriptional regulator [Shinella sp.]|nr:MAG: LysR family transcriptional regulator [Shinella sp.]